MPRPKNPQQFAKVTGADTRNPQRYEGRADPVVDVVGDPPARLSPAQSATWRLFVSEVPWLRKSDRALLEIACRLRSRMETDPDMGIAALAQFRLCLSAMGATPVDRSKITFEGGGGDDPASEFVN